MKKLICLITAVFTAFLTNAQAQEVEMADGMRAEGKIYVIVAIILIVIAGLFIYLFMLDRKVKKIEDSLK